MPLAALVAVLLFSGCSSTPKTPDAKNGEASRVSNADEQVLKQDPIERNYDPHVIMKRAEAFFEKEDYAEAIVEYQHFLDLHKTHTLAPYAQYRLGMSYFKQVSTRDRDPEPTRHAMETMQKLLKEFPGSPYEDDARSKIKECREHLAGYELYVGKHYYRQEAYLGALHRFEGLLGQYPDAEVSAEAWYYLALTYRDIGAKERAIRSLTTLVQQFPKSMVRSQGQQLLASLGVKSVTTNLADASPSAAPKTSLPAPLPKTRSLSVQPPALPPAGVNGALPPVITCGLNVSC